MVPTMFVRLLRLPSDERGAHDLSSLRAVIHAAAPCPPEVKRQMIEWLGPIVYEYYSATEVYLLTAIDSEDWLAHPGSVGQALLGRRTSSTTTATSCRPARSGTIWSEGGPQFEYHNDPEKTAATRNERGWTTVGDIGYLDEEGYLYLTDRKADMIISGGVNIYPQEAENVLVTHPAVADAAVFGIPHDELGEEVKARRAAAARQRDRRPSSRPSCSPSATSGWRSTSARARSTSPTSCRATRPASSTSACCATSTPQAAGPPST